MVIADWAGLSAISRDLSKERARVRCESGHGHSGLSRFVCHIASNRITSLLRAMWFLKGASLKNPYVSRQCHPDFTWSWTLFLSGLYCINCLRRIDFIVHSVYVVLTLPGSRVISRPIKLIRVFRLCRPSFTWVRSLCLDRTLLCVLAMSSGLHFHSEFISCPDFTVYSAFVVRALLESEVISRRHSTVSSPYVIRT